MSTREQIGAERSGRARLPTALIVGLLVGAIVLAFFLREARSGLAERLASLIIGRSTSYISAPDVVEKIQRLSRLETVAYSLDTVVEGKESNPVLPDALAGDRLLMIVHGQTLAGIDFSKLKRGDVQITDGRDGRFIRLTLPPSEVFLTTIDNAKTRVYVRDTGLFVSADPNLETATRLRAQGELQAAALNDGILLTARENAQGTVRALLEGLGFTRIVLQ